MAKMTYQGAFAMTVATHRMTPCKNVATVQTWSFHGVALEMTVTGKKCTKIQNMCRTIVLLMEPLFVDILFDVTIVVCQSSLHVLRTTC